MKGSIYYTGGIIQTYGNVLWVDKLTSNILSNDEQIALEFDQHKQSSGLY